MRWDYFLSFRATNFFTLQLPFSLSFYKQWTNGVLQPKYEITKYIVPLYENTMKIHFNILLYDTCSMCYGTESL